MSKRRIVGRWPVVGLIAVVAIALSLAVIVRQQDTASAACGANACISVDADPSTAGIDGNIVVPTGTNFDISFEGSAIPAATVQGYQWEIQFTSGVVSFVSETENSGVTGASLCSAAAPNGSAPAGKVWIGNGAGCLRPSGTFAAGAVRLTTVTLQCDPQAPAGSTSELHLVTGGDGASGEDPTFGTIYLGPGGAFVTTDLADATVQCGAGTPATATDTSVPATATPTVPLVSTNTPGATNTSEPPVFTRTPTPTATAAGAATVAPGGQTPPPSGGGTQGGGTQGGGTAPGGGTQGTIRPPNTGSGGVGPSRAGLLPILAVSLIAGAIAVVGWKLRRHAAR